ncbi:hypothetical protein PQX77_011495 [Marasmius sp. AFHP31]|nr:hypothetical protein PQX77_011495 [Marasmius sp. AFHP31]
MTVEEENEEKETWTEDYRMVSGKFRDSKVPTLQTSSATAIMTDVFSLELDTPAFKGKVALNTGLFIDGKFVEPFEKGSKIE